MEEKSNFVILSLVAIVAIVSLVLLVTGIQTVIPVASLPTDTVGQGTVSTKILPAKGNLCGARCNGGGSVYCAQFSTNKKCTSCNLVRITTTIFDSEFAEIIPSIPSEERRIIEETV